MSKHLTLTDRAIIEKHIAQDMSFAYIARCLNRSATTISREVKNHRCFVNGVRYTSNDCVHYRTCLRRNLCIARYLINHPMYVPVARKKKHAKEIMRIILPTELMLNMSNSSVVPEKEFAPVQSALWN